MDKSIALDIMHEFLDQKDHDFSADDFWLQSDDKIIGTMGFKDDKLNYVTTDWDKNIDYLDSIELFNTLFSVLKNTFGSNYGGNIILWSSFKFRDLFNWDTYYSRFDISFFAQIEFLYL